MYLIKEKYKDKNLDCEYFHIFEYNFKIFEKSIYIHDDNIINTYYIIFDIYGNSTYISEKVGEEIFNNLINILII